MIKSVRDEVRTGFAQLVESAPLAPENQQNVGDVAANHIAEHKAVRTSRDWIECRRNSSGLDVPNPTITAPTTSGVRPGALPDCHSAADQRIAAKISRKQRPPIKRRYIISGTTLPQPRNNGITAWLLPNFQAHLSIDARQQIVVSRRTPAWEWTPPRYSGDIYDRQRND